MRLPCPEEKKTNKLSSTSIPVEGLGDQQMASVITDNCKYANAGTNELEHRLDSIYTGCPKPFKFMVAPIADLFHLLHRKAIRREERGLNI